jgi:hypothetical protein
MPADTLRACGLGSENREVEVPRADLSAILVEAAEMLRFFRRDDHPDSPADSGVDVIFDRGGATRL